MVSCASPVPGGMSTTITSSVPDSTSRSICVNAEITIGPRQIIGVSSDEEADRHHSQPITRNGLEPRAADRLRPLLMASSFGSDGP